LRRTRLIQHPKSSLRLFAVRSNPPGFGYQHIHLESLGQNQNHENIFQKKQSSGEGADGTRMTASPNSVNRRLARAELTSNAEATRTQRLGPGHWCGPAKLGPGYGSGGSPPTITTTYTYDDADELTQWTTSTVTMTFTYASDGCLKTKSDGTDTWTYDWDFERRLNAFKKNSATLVEYAHNPTGTRRYSSDSTLGLTNYFYSGGHVLADYSSNWTLTKSYIMGPSIDEIIAMIDRASDPNVTHYFTRDRLGSTRELVNSSETVNTRYSYDVWGDPAETQLAGSVSTDYLYRGWSYSSTSEHYGGTGVNYDAGLGRVYERITTQLPTLVYALVNPCTSLLQQFQPGDWGKESRERDDCGPCCDEKYADCRRHKMSDILVAERRYEHYLEMGWFHPANIAPRNPDTSPPTDCEEEKKKCRKYCWDAWWAGSHENDPEFGTYYLNWVDCAAHYPYPRDPYVHSVNSANWLWSSKTACGDKLMCCAYGLALYDEAIQNTCDTREWCITYPNDLVWCGDPPPFYNEENPIDSLSAFCERQY